MAKSKEKMEYEFEDLRRNTDPVPTPELGFDTDDPDDEGGQGDPDGEGDPDDLGDPDDGGDEETVSVSEMNRRITKVRRESDRKLTAAQEEAGTEIGALRKRLDGMEHTGELETLDEGHKTAVAEIESKIEAAMEEGDHKAVTALTVELSEATVTNVTKREALKRKADEHDEPDDLHKRGEPAVIPRAKDWLAEQDWWEDRDNAHIRRFVNSLDKALQEKGYSPHDDDFYEQLEERIEAKYPGVIVHTMDDLDPDDEGGEGDEFSDIPNKRSSTKKKARRSARKSPVNSGGRGGTGGKKKRSSKRGKTLDRTRVANMRMFGMDPDNKEHVEAYMEQVTD